MNVMILTADGFCFGPFRSDYDYQQKVSNLPLSSLPVQTHVVLDPCDMPERKTTPVKTTPVRDCTYCIDPNGEMPPVMMHGNIDNCPSCGRSL